MRRTLVGAYSGQNEFSRSIIDNSISSSTELRACYPQLSARSSAAQPGRGRRSDRDQCGAGAGAACADTAWTFASGTVVVLHPLLSHSRHDQYSNVARTHRLVAMLVTNIT